MQAESAEELAAIRAQFAAADSEEVFDEPNVNCCYARGNKHWTKDPQGIAWEAFHTLDSVPVYGRGTSRQKSAHAANTATQCCGPAAATGSAAPRTKGVLRMKAVDRPYNVLFLCTGNSARSIMAESLLREIGRGRFNAYSAGSQPKGRVHPKALELLESRRMPTEGLSSKAGMYSPNPTRRKWISSSRSATTPPAKCAPCGPGSQ